VQTIEQLQRDRTGAQELLDEIASTVSRTENLWLVTMTRKGNSLSMEGAAASVNSVANFITALKRSGYFQKVEIKETKQDDKTSGIQTFLFQMTAEINPPQLAPIAPRPQQPKAVGSPAAVTAPAKKG
jgi:Tfp pilus assembly protein PilN